MIFLVEGQLVQIRNYFGPTNIGIIIEEVNKEGFSTYYRVLMSDGCQYKIMTYDCQALL